MPSYCFRCDLCGYTEDVWMDISEYYGIIPCANAVKYGDRCDGMMLRVWSSPSIGRVSGAGNSPARFPSD